MRSVLLRYPGSRLTAAATLVAGLVLTPWDVSAQPSPLPRGGPSLLASSPRPDTIGDDRIPARPFAAGERLRYDVRFGWKTVGEATMLLDGPVPFGRATTWHTTFTIRGGIPFFRINDRLESWFDITTLSSRRFYQQIAEGSYRRTRDYQISPERAVFQLNGGPEEPSVSAPLDEAAFFYAVRTLPLEVGTTLELPRYFNPQGNPVRIHVVRRETIRVPAGVFRTIVLQPTFQTRGLFSQNGRAELWLSDDPSRVLVQMRSHLPVGSIELRLTDLRRSESGSPLATQAGTPPAP